MSNANLLVDAGSPAWAGIDPVITAGVWGAIRFPRVGGDRPRASAMRTNASPVPPRGRG